MLEKFDLLREAYGEAKGNAELYISPEVAQWLYTAVCR